MTSQYKIYSIRIENDETYSLNSTDNTHHYDKEYFYGLINEDRFYPTSKYGIRIFLNNKEISSAIICEVGGGTSVNNNSFVFADDGILICCYDKVYSLELPTLVVNWVKRCDPATCFGIYNFLNDFLIHGELSISRIDKNGHEKWNFGARDIFVTQDNSSAFVITENKIMLKDWEGYKYVLDENGSVLESKR